MPIAVARPLLLLATLAAPLAGQAWQSGSAEPLVAAATAARISRDADTLLAGWQAVASGVVRFAVVLGHGGGSIERVIRADELRVEVYGEAPNRSKQRIVAWRDSILAPTRIVYHRDHLGIVAHDFGPLIRLGQSEEVRDVPHPLSPAGMAHYEFRVRDTVEVSGAGNLVRVVAVDVRPRDPGAIGTIGTLYLDAERAALVRFQFTFTAPSYRDPTVDAITVVLENAFVDARRWLPWRQAITIRREGPLLAMPMQTLLRADWVIGQYQLGVSHPDDLFRGALVAGLAAPGGTDWDAPFAAALDGLPTTEGDIASLVTAAVALAPGSRISGLPTLRLLGDRGLSSLLRVNRVQGITPGAGVRLAVDDRTQLNAAMAFGTADGRLTGRFELARRAGGLTLALGAGREVVDVADGTFGSGLMNSLAAATTGDDAGSWLLREHLTASVTAGQGLAARWGVALHRERIGSLASRFTALDGSRRTNPPLGHGTADRVAAWIGSTTQGWRLAAEVGDGVVGWGRADLAVSGRLAPLAWRVDAGVGTRDLPGYRSFVTGGRATLVGVPHRSLGGRRLARVELALPLALGVPAPGLRGGLGRGLLGSRLEPYVAAAITGGAVAGVPWQASGDVEPVLGLRLDLWGPLLRLEAGWAVRDGAFGITLDAHPDWWPLL